MKHFNWQLLDYWGFYSNLKNDILKGSQLAFQEIPFLKRAPCRSTCGFFGSGRGYFSSGSCVRGGRPPWF